jgi:hypothetical protein
VGGGDVANVVHIEAEQSTHLRLSQQRFGTLEAVAAEAAEIDSLLP